MIIQSLYDNCTLEDSRGEADHGFSVLVSHQGTNLLIDAGASAEIFKRNAAALGADLSAIDAAVLSHAHNDHATGLDELLEQNKHVLLYLPPDAFIGFPATDDPKKAKYHLDNKVGFRYRNARQEFVSIHKEITPGVSLIVTRSNLIGYFSDYPPKPKKYGMPELSVLIALENGKGLAISGCSHSGIDEIVSACIDWSGRPVDFVIGGFHMRSYSDDVVHSTALRLKEMGVSRIAPTHCTGKQATSVMADVFGPGYVEFGLGATINVS